MQEMSWWVQANKAIRRLFTMMPKLEVLTVREADAGDLDFFQCLPGLARVYLSPTRAGPDWMVGTTYEGAEDSLREAGDRVAMD